MDDNYISFYIKTFKLIKIYRVLILFTVDTK